MCFTLFGHKELLQRNLKIKPLLCLFRVLVVEQSLKQPLAM